MEAPHNLKLQAKIVKVDIWTDNRAKYDLAIERLIECIYKKTQ